MEYTPKPKNRIVLFMAACFFVCGIIMVASAQIISSQKGVMMILGVVFFTGCIYVTVRYRMTSFTYVVNERSRLGEDGSKKAVEGGYNGIKSLDPCKLDFIVLKKQGNRQYTVNMTSLGKLYQCESLPARGKMRRNVIKEAGKMDLYKYLVQPYAPDQYLLVFKSSNETIGYDVELDEEMFGYLSAVARYNRDKKKKASVYD